MSCYDKMKSRSVSTSLIFHWIDALETMSSLVISMIPFECYKKEDHELPVMFFTDID